MTKLNLGWKTSLHVYDDIPNEALGILYQNIVSDAFDQFNSM